jgi:hypothetical protein
LDLLEDGFCDAVFDSFIDEVIFWPQSFFDFEVGVGV